MLKGVVKTEIRYGFLTLIVAMALSFSAVSAYSDDDDDDDASGSPFKTEFILDTSSTLAPGAAESQSTGYSVSGLYRLTPTYSFNPDLKLMARASYGQEYSYARDDGATGAFNDTLIKLSENLWRSPGKTTKWGIALSATMPTSPEAQRATLKSGFGLSTPFEWKKGYWDVKVETGFTRYFHEMEIQYNGDPNNQYSLWTIIEPNYKLSEKWSLDLTLWPIQSWTYSGYTRAKYITAYEVDYELHKNLTLAIGLMTNADALRDNGLDYNYTLYDQNQTTGYFDVVINI